MTRRFFIWLTLILSSLASAQQYSTGANFDIDEYEAQPGLATFSRRDVSNLPKKVDFRPFCPAPGNQGEFGTCVGWSSAYHARTILDGIRSDRKGATLNSREAFSPSYVYNQIREESGCVNGTNLGHALALMTSHGALKANEVLFDCGRSDWSNYQDQAAAFRIKNFLRLHSLNSNNKTLPVKKALAEGQPVVIGMHLVKSFFSTGDDGFFRPTAEERTIVLNPEFFEARKYQGHAMAVIGYDDSKGRAGAFQIINSWGKEWGDDGFCWVEYEDFNRYVSSSYSMIDFPVYKEDLNGSFVMETEKGVSMNGSFAAARGAYRLAKVHPPGTRFRIYLKNDAPIYLYAFGFDKTGKTFKLFPHKEGVSAYVPYDQSHIPIPDEDHFIEIDATPGRNDLCVLYSMKELPFDKLLARIDGEGEALVKADTPLRGVVETVLKALAIAVVPPEQTKYAPEAYEFTTKRTDESCVPLVMEFGN